MSRSLRWPVAMLAVVGLTVASYSLAQNPLDSLEWQIPNRKAQLPFAKEQPIVFVSAKNFAEWSKLPGYWNVFQEEVVDPISKEKITRTGVKIKMPLGLTVPPKVPAENPMTAQRWELGRRLYFDGVLCSDASVSCASCHNPKLGFTDQSAVSVGISGNKGGVSAPTVMNSGLQSLQFWDGRASSLEDQAQGPPQNPIEMFDGHGNAWHELVKRVRKKGDYTSKFLEAFGTEPTRDTIAKAIATYERTVLNGNSIHDRAEQAMRFRVAEEEGTNFTIKPADYAKVIEEAIAKKDGVALNALGAGAIKDVKDTAAKIDQGRVLFFGKARCALCHVGENFTDGLFHNLGVGAKDGKLHPDNHGRFVRLPTGNKDPEMIGAFKTPTLRGLTSTAPYLHDGSEITLEQVVDFYDRGGNANEFLSPKMRDLEAEAAYINAKRTGQAYKGPEVKLFGDEQKPIVPFKLNLTKEEKGALVLFLRSLEGEVDQLVTGPNLPVPVK